MTVDRDRPRTRMPDVVASVLLVCVHIGLALFMAFVAPFLAMGTDPCAYQACGDEHWVVRAMYLAWGGGAALVLADVLLTVLLLTRHRVAFYVPLIGCLSQLALGMLVLQLASWAGPL